MRLRIPFLLASALLAHPALSQDAAKPTDTQIAHIAYTAGVIDIEAAKLAQSRSDNKQVKGFAADMIRDHEAVNEKALALVKKLGVTPEDNPVSQSLKEEADAKLSDLKALKGAAFDRAYAQNEVAYHRQVNAALQDTLIPSAQNSELKSLLSTGLRLFQGHEQHAEHLSQALR